MLLCSLLTVVSILRITFDVGIYNNYLHLLHLVTGLILSIWIFECLRDYGVDGVDCLQLRYTPNDAGLIVECQRLWPK
ncbi:hypothetical protein Lalb_Chr09g0330361 [Lupinus albus]|uniref:Uncharacterized protein n=1 Tax=Lupinus albus TaxID=3870 RepID=A0A6A4Q1H9_LUPAL|nr:hypothetical protein Lalb_Chr09g0330361 [Lupinus albus]